MSSTSGNIVATRVAAKGRPLNILLWCFQAFLALVFVSTAWAKLMGKPEMVALFTAVGFGQWFRYVTGILELTGAVLDRGAEDEESWSRADRDHHARRAHRTPLHLARSTHYTGRPV